MLKYWQKVKKASYGMAIVLLLTSIATSAVDPVLNSKLQAIIARVQMPSDQDAALDELLNQMTGVDPKSLDDKTIGNLEALLKRPEYDVREVATISLGQIGRKAKIPDRALNKKFEEAIELVRAGKSQSERIDAADNLSELTVGIDPSYVSDKTIADMISLLDDPNDGVIAYVSAALGVFGPRAKAAVPKLLALLPAIDCIQADVPSS